MAEEENEGKESQLEGVTFENRILEVLGDFGPFQRWVFALMTLTDIPLGMAMLYFMFSNANPGTRCRTYEGNVTYDNDFAIGGDIACVKNGTRCVEFEFKKEYTSIITDFGLVCDYDYIPDLTVTIQFTGLIIGASLSGQMSDRFGRKTPVVTAITLMMISQSLVSFATSWQMFAAARFFVGVFNGAATGINFILPMEMVGSKWRTVCGCLGVYSIGHMLLCLIAYLTADWEYLAFFSGVICLPLSIVIQYFVPESPRWLIQKSRFSEAEKVILRMAHFNRKTPPDMKCLKEICAVEAGDREKASRFSYLDLFTTKTFATYTLVMMYLNFSIAQIYYGVILQISSFTGSVYLNAFISACITLPARWAVIPFASRFGRRKSFAFVNVIAIACMSVIVLLSGLGYVQQYPALLTTFALMGKGAIYSMWGVSSLFNIELFPTLIRSIGIATGNISCRVGGMLAPQFAYLGTVIHWTFPYIIHGCLATGCIILVTVFLPETNKMPLPENPPPRRFGLNLSRSPLVEKELHHQELPLLTEDMEDDESDIEQSEF